MIDYLKTADDDKWTSGQVVILILTNKLKYPRKNNLIISFVPLRHEREKFSYFKLSKIINLLY